MMMAFFLSALNRNKLIEQTAKDDAARFGKVEICVEQDPGGGSNRPTSASPSLPDIRCKLRSSQGTGWSVRIPWPPGSRRGMSNWWKAPVIGTIWTNCARSRRGGLIRWTRQARRSTGLTTQKRGYEWRYNGKGGNIRVKMGLGLIFWSDSG
jgi:hypothetical protein